MWLMENPIAILVGGTLLVAILIGGTLQTGRRSVLYSAIATALITVLLLVVERYVVTPKEHVRETLNVIADRLERNDIPGVLDYISQGKLELRSEAERKMMMYRLSDVQIKRNLKIDLDEHRGEEVAEAQFTATMSIAGGNLELHHQPLFFKVQFRNEAGVWRVRDYQLDNIRDALGMGRP